MSPAASAPLFSRRALVLALLAQAASAVPGCTATGGRPASRPRLRLIGETRLPHGLQFKGTTVGGLSGLDFDPVKQLWYALSDDGSSLQPARFYTLRMQISRDALGTPELVDAITLRQPDGAPYAGQKQGGIGPDPEALRLRPQTGTLLWADEGDIRRGQDPALHEVTPEGIHLRGFPLPSMFKAGQTGTGPRHNLTFEGLALLPDGGSAWAAMESALLQDGPVPAVGIPGGPCRITLFDMAGGRALRQLAYMPDAIPAAPLPARGFADNGVSEILMIDAFRMLVLERAYMAGVGNSLRLYQIDTRAGTDTLGAAALREGAYQPCPKTLVLDFAASGLGRLDNTEAMAWGPLLPGGSRTLVFASDDNFNPAQITQFAAFEYQEEE